jgi:hypothetical protein
MVENFRHVGTKPKELHEGKTQRIARRLKDTAFFEFFASLLIAVCTLYNFDPNIFLGNMS